MKFDWKDIKLNYKIIGEGKPVLMIHGFMPDHRLMLGAMEPIFRPISGYKRIYFDLPGMGESGSGAYIKNSDHMLEAVLALIDAIIGKSSFLVIGESYGGYLARGVIHKRPDQVDGAAFICPMIIPDRGERHLPSKEVIHKNSEFMKSLSERDYEMYESIAVVQDEKTFNHFKEFVIPGLEVANQPFLERLQDTGYAFTFARDIISKVFEKPALFLNGKQDTSVGYKDAWGIMDLYPRGTYVALDRAGHSLESEQSGLLDALMREWLFRCSEQRT